MAGEEGARGRCRRGSTGPASRRLPATGRPARAASARTSGFVQLAQREAQPRQRGRRQRGEHVALVLGRVGGARAAGRRSVDARVVAGGEVAAPSAVGELEHRVEPHVAVAAHARVRASGRRRGRPGTASTTPARNASRRSSVRCGRPMPVREPSARAGRPCAEQHDALARRSPGRATARASRRRPRARRARTAARRRRSRRRRSSRRACGRAAGGGAAPARDGGAERARAARRRPGRRRGACPGESPPSSAATSRAPMRAASSTRRAAHERHGRRWPRRGRAAARRLEARVGDAVAGDARGRGGPGRRRRRRRPRRARAGGRVAAPAGVAQMLLEGRRRRHAPSVGLRASAGACAPARGGDGRSARAADLGATSGRRACATLRSRSTTTIGRATARRRAPRGDLPGTLADPLDVVGGLDDRAAVAATRATAPCGPRGRPSARPWLPEEDDDDLAVGQRVRARGTGRPLGDALRRPAAAAALAAGCAARGGRRRRARRGGGRLARAAGRPLGRGVLRRPSRRWPCSTALPARPCLGAAGSPAAVAPARRRRRRRPARPWASEDEHPGAPRRPRRQTRSDPDRAGDLGHSSPVVGSARAGA